jgi:hypothetical protein
MNSITSKISIIILSLMACTFTFAEDKPEHLHDAPLTSIHGDAMAPDQSSTEDEELQNQPSEDPQTESEAPFVDSSLPIGFSHFCMDASANCWGK